MRLTLQRAAGAGLRPAAPGARIPRERRGSHLRADRRTLLPRALGAPAPGGGPGAANACPAQRFHPGGIPALRGARGRCFGGAAHRGCPAARALARLCASWPRRWGWRRWSKRTTGPSWRRHWRQARAWWEINNRDLHTFNTTLETTLRLRPLVPPGVVVVAESGIHNRADVDCLAQAGVDALLVGEALVTAPDTAAKVRELAR